VTTAEVVAELARHLDRPLVVVDVGAQSLAGEDHVYAPLIALDIDVRIIGFEPLPARAAARRADESGRDCTIIEAFIGDGGVHTFHECNSSGASSLLELDTDVCSHFASLRGLRMVRSHRVLTTTLDTALAGKGAIDFLKLDIQGFELAALRGATRALEHVAMIQTEAEFVPLYRDQPLFSDIDIFLRGHGFDFLDFHTLARRSPVVPSGRLRNEHLLWSDAVFAARIDRANQRTLLAQAILALGLYDRWSVAERALAAYDAQRGSDLATLLGRDFRGNAPQGARGPILTLTTRASGETAHPIKG
jgi:FkbM family methyltransferase